MSRKSGLPDGNYGPNGLTKPKADPYASYPSPYTPPPREPHVDIDNDDLRKQTNRERHSSYRK